MIKIQKQEPEYSPAPANLKPIIFHCGDCGSTVRKLEQTDSYVLVSLHVSVEKGQSKICPFCYRLQQLRGPTS